LALRVCYIAVDEGAVVGFAAGHLTRRYGCAGEVQWLTVVPDRRRQGVAGALVRELAGWFHRQGAGRVCVDVDPQNGPARALYTRLGAAPLNPHWLVWNDISLLAPQKVH
jgi:GNAT superfamily N-acetyltransferase